jgi:hypothetical protein
MPIDPNAPIPPAVLTILATLFAERASAEGVLEIVGYPRNRYPVFDQPQHFWRQITQEIRHGILPDGRNNNDLLRAMAELYPGHPGLAEWRLSAGQAEVRPRAEPGPVKVLFLAANPIASNHLRVDAEARAIQRIGRKSATMARRIEIEVYQAVQTEDLIDAVEATKPIIVHFAGHGESAGGLVLDDGRGGNQTVTFDALGQLFKELSDEGVQVRCVILNGCYTAEAIPALGMIVDVIIGSYQEVADDSSIEFAQGFYTSLAEGKSVGKSIRRGKLKMKLVEPPSYLRGENPQVFHPGNLAVNVSNGLDLERTFL